MTQDSTLRALIKTQILQHPEAGPEELALYVSQATPAESLRNFYAHLLIGACRSQINQHRSGSKHGAPKPRGKKSTNSKTPPPSPKLAERRTWWAEMLSAEMHLAAGTRKTLGECNAMDLRYCIKEREAHIGQVENQISNLQRLVELMGQHRVATVRELPEQQQWGRAS